MALYLEKIEKHVKLPCRLLESTHCVELPSFDTAWYRGRDVTYLLTFLVCFGDFFTGYEYLYGFEYLTVFTDGDFAFGCLKNVCLDVGVVVGLRTTGEEVVAPTHFPPLHQLWCPQGDPSTAGR